MEPLINERMRVSTIIRTWPRTVPVFLQCGCPDMRTGFFSVMARVMPLSLAAKVHRIDLERLLADLNRAAAGEPDAPAPPAVAGR